MVNFLEYYLQLDDQGGSTMYYYLSTNKNILLVVTSFIQQIGFLYNKLRTDIVRVKYRRIFVVSRQKFQKCNMKYLHEDGIGYVPSILSPLEFQMVENEINRLHQVSYYLANYRISEYIYNYFHSNFLF